jgi:hypothetical protein
MASGIEALIKRDLTVTSLQEYHNKEIHNHRNYLLPSMAKGGS